MTEAFMRGFLKEAETLAQGVGRGAVIGGASGALGGGLRRAFDPTEEDEAEQRGALHRTLRGMGRGAVVGGGLGAAVYPALRVASKWNDPHALKERLEGMGAEDITWKP